MAAQLPSGTVTFLLTDVQGSTKLWEEHPEAMAVAMARHDAIATAACEGRHERAARLLAFSRAEGQQVRTPTGFGLYTHYRNLVRAALGSARSRELRDEGRRMTLQGAVAHALEEDASTAAAGSG